MEMIIVKQNLRHNFSIYKMYLISATIILSFFGSFINFVNDKVMMEKISENNRVEQMASVIFVVFVIFVIFYFAYLSMFFLKNRSKELGTMSLLGFSKSKMIAVLLVENLIVIALAYVLSIFLSVAIYFIISTILVTVLKLGIDIRLFFSNQTIIYSTYLMILILIVNLFSNIFIVKSRSILEFTNYSSNNEKRINNKNFLAILGLACLLLSYILCIDTIRSKDSIWIQIGVNPVLLITGLLLLIGTILFIRYSLIYYFNYASNKSSIAYTPVGNIILPKYVHRLSTKNKLIITITFLVTLTTLFMGMMTITLYYPIKAVDRLVPSAIEYTKSENDDEMNARAMSLAEKYGANINEIRIIKVYPDKKIPITESGQSVNYLDVISQKDYLSILASQGKKVNEFSFGGTNEEAVLSNYYPTDKPIGMHFHLADNIDVEIKKVTLHNPFSFYQSVSTLIVSDDIFNKLLKDNPKDLRLVISLNGHGLKDSEELYKEFSKINSEVQSSYNKKKLVVRANASTFLFISFIAVLFIICTGSVLYFVNLIEIIRTKKEYLYLEKLGYNKKLIKKIIGREVGILFLIPLLVGMISGSFLILIFRYLFMDNLISTNLITLAVLGSYGVFIMCYFVFFLLTKHTASNSVNMI